MAETQIQAQLTLEFRKAYRNWFKSLSDSFPTFKTNIIKYYKAHMDKPPTELLQQFHTQANPFFEVLGETDADADAETDAEAEKGFFNICATFYPDIEYHTMMTTTEKGRDKAFRRQQLALINHLCYYTVLLLADSSASLRLSKFLENAETASAVSKIAETASAAMAAGGGGLPKDILNNSLISSLAEEISKDVQIPDSFKNMESPQDIFKLMMNKDGKDFMEEMVKTVSGKIQDKIKNGELSEQDLFAQAQSMMGSVFQNNPMFNNLSNFFGGSGGAESAAVVAANEQQRKSDLRKALKEKLKNKRH